MSQIKNSRILAAIIAAGALIGSSICFSAAYLIPAIMICGVNYSGAEARISTYEKLSPDMTGLYFLAWLFLLLFAGLTGFIVWSVLPPQEDIVRKPDVATA